MAEQTAAANDTRWYEDAVLYQVDLRAFADGNGDGIGDIEGLVGRLDYLQGLGVSALWLRPLFPSPLHDDGYDIADFTAIHPDLGTLEQFRALVAAAHERNLRVILELVIEYTSSEHAWFHRARRAKPGSAARTYYVWSDAPETLPRIAGVNWTPDPSANSYYRHRFRADEPDLNFDNPAVGRAIMRVVDFWFDLGVDGLRLDAAAYLYEREGEGGEDLPDTHAFLRKLRRHIDRKHEAKVLLTEARPRPEQAAAYFGSGDECHMVSHFGIMERLLAALRSEDSVPVTELIDATPTPVPGCQWTTSLRCHDGRLGGSGGERTHPTHRRFADGNESPQRRPAPLLGNNRREIELINVLLFSLPGAPVIYYGDEIGMGDNVYLGAGDGVRTPMQWSPDRNAGFSVANPQKLYLPVISDPEYHHEAVNVENQERNLSSLLWWMKRLIAMRGRLAPLRRGTTDIVGSDNHKVLSFVRSYEDESVLVVANLSSLPQIAALELSDYAGCIPEEAFGGTGFGIIGRRPYTLTLAPHTHFWLVLKRSGQVMRVFDREMLPTIRVTGGVEKVLSGEPRRGLEEVVLPGYMRMSRWFGSKAKKIRSVRIAESIPFDSAGAFGALLLLDVAYTTGEQERYCLPVSYAGEQLADAIREESPQTIIGVVESGTDGTSGILYDSSADSAFHRALFLLMAGKGRIRGARGMLRGRRGDSGLAAIDTDEKVPPSHLLKAEQSNTSIRFGESYFLKIYRKLDRGTNPEVELLGFLTSKTRFRHAPGYAGSIEFRSGSAEPTSVAIMQSFVRADGEAWGYFRDAAGHYFDHLLEQRPEEELEHALPSLLEAGPDRIPEPLSRRVGDKPLRLAALLGQRTAELHRALGSRRDVPLFAPEPLDRSYLGGLYRSMDALAGRALDALATRRTHLPPSVQEPARAVLARRDDIRARLKAVTNITGGGMRIRIHGDYHLGQVLRIGNDFIIMDFEGEPARPVRERKEKYPPFKDVAGMVRSFHYAAYGNLLLGRGVRSADVALLERWAGPWYICTAGAFLRGYLDTIGAESIVPKGARQRRALLDVFLLEKSVYELLYELNNRPAWSAIPMKGIVNILSSYEGKVIV